MTTPEDMNVTDANVSDPYDNMYMGGPPGPPPDPTFDFRKYASIITCIVGIVGNVIIFLVFTRTKLKKPSTARYLAAAAVADSGFLCAVLSINLDLFYNVSVHNVVGPCQLITFGDHAFAFLSRWYLTSVIIEKLIGVMWPRKKSNMCTVFRAKCVIISLAILSIVCYLYVTWFVGVDGNPPACRMYFLPQVIQPWILLSKIDAIVNFVLPYFVIFVFTCLIGCQSWRYHKRSMSASERFLRRRGVTRPEDKEFKTTPLLILLASSTLVLCIPNSSMRLLSFSSTYRPTPMTMTLMHIFHYLVVLNSSIKLFIYIIASRTFARQVGRSACALKNVWRKSDDEELQTRHITSNLDHDIMQNEVTFREGKV